MATGRVEWWTRREHRLLRRISRRNVATGNRLATGTSDGELDDVPFEFSGEKTWADKRK